MTSTKILITGASGFIGQILTKHLLLTTPHTLVLTDLSTPSLPTGIPSSSHSRVNTLPADLSTSASTIVTPDLTAVYILHGIMSSGAESSFDAGMSANLDSTRSLLNVLRATCPGIRVIYASSGAVYGQPLPALPNGLTEAVLPTPESSYGAAKLMVEILINDYTRRGWINGFSLRFPTITVRPGKPTAAASSFLSGMVREPLAGQECVIPIANLDWTHWVSSPRTLVWNLVHMLQVERDALPPHVRSVNVPGFQVSVRGMMEALERVAGKEVVGRIRVEEEEGTRRILESWADRYDNTLALGLGMRQDKDFERNIRDYMEDLEVERKAAQV